MLPIYKLTVLVYNFFEVKKLKKFLYKRMYIWCLLPVSFLLVFFAKLDNRWVESFFVPFIYKPLSFVIGLFVSLFPFSVTEYLAVIGAGLIIFYLVRKIICIVKTKRWKRTVYEIFINAVSLASVALFLFEICMGLNYYRYTVTDYLGLEVTKSSTEELYDLCVILVNDMNKYRAELETDENGVALLNDKNRTRTSNSARDAYKALSKKYPFLKSADIRGKPLVSSKLFSMVTTTGIYIPYTFESNINVDVPEHTIPATMCHELTHYRGFMRENEANFLGYLACMESDRADFKYSGSLMAFQYCFSALYKDDSTLGKKIANMCVDGIVTDIAREEEYWEPFLNTKVNSVSEQVYDTYLNLNDVEDGVKSYGRMIDLLLAYYRKS